MSIITASLSKQVGHILPGYLKFPTADEVRKASHFQLLQWYRFLVAETAEEVAIINLINYRVVNEKAPELTTEQINLEVENA